MLTEFPKSGKFLQSGMHSLSRGTRFTAQKIFSFQFTADLVTFTKEILNRKLRFLIMKAITIIKDNASASTEPLINSCTLNNHTCRSIFCISILVILLKFDAIFCYLRILI